MMKNVLSVLIWISLISTCDQNERSSTVPAALPSTWPLSFLTLPSDATQEIVGMYGGKHSSSFVVDGEEESTTTSDKQRKWLVGFDSKQGWEAIRHDLEVTLKQHEFKKIDEEFYETDDSIIVERRASYQSKDLSYTVMLFYKHDNPASKQDRFEGYLLAIYKDEAKE